MEDKATASNTDANTAYTFHTDQIAYEIIETKSGKDFYITGYISTPDIDLVNDVVSPNAMKSMLTQIKSSTITLDYEHEAFRDDPSILPVGKIIEAKLDDRGLWVKCKLNNSSPKFKDLWGSVKGGFVNAFSIAFTNVKAATTKMGDSIIRIIEDLTLLNVALTGVPVNPKASLAGYSMKSVFLKAIGDYEKKAEDTKMSEEEIKNDVSQEEVKKVEEVVEKAPEETKVKVAEEKPVEAKSEDLEAVKKELKSLSEQIETQKTELKSLRETSVFKSKIVDEAPKEEVVEGREVKSILELL